MPSTATAKAAMVALMESFKGELGAARLQYPGTGPGSFATLTATFGSEKEELPLLQPQHVESGLLLAAHSPRPWPALHF